MDALVRNLMQPIARAVVKFVPPGWGFALFVFPLDGREGLMHHVYNGEAKDVVSAMKEFIAKNENEPDLGGHSEEVV